jgi:Uncharacterized NAD(FAD)-dependent dehydrogenases
VSEKLIVIGGTAAGLSAASKAKRLNKDFDILVFEKSGYISYGACGLPYFVGGIIEDADELVSVSVADMKAKRGIEVRTHHEVTAIDRKAKTVTVKNLDNGEVAVHEYDKLVIATGAFPVHPSLPGIDADGVYYLRNVEDGIQLKNGRRDAKNAVIIGGGFIGLELAEQLTEAGIKVTICEALDRLLPFLPEAFSASVASELEKHGVNLLTGAKVEKIEVKNGKVSGVKTSAGSVEADTVVVSIGVVPASGLAKDAGLELGLRGAIVVNDEMQTSDPSIWAAGDCIQVKNSITGKPCYIPLGTTANKTGRVAGSNIGGEKSEFAGVLGSSVTKVFDLSIASTGLSLKAALDAGFDAVESSISKNDRASYYPGAEENRLNFVFDRKSGRMLGASGIGSSTVAGRINVMAAAITAKMTVSEVNELDLVYAPPFAPVYDPILIAASQAEKKVGK